SFYHEKLNPFEKDELVIVSCAKIRDVKRIHLIAEALMHIDIPCKWFHLGDENLDAKNDESIPKYIKAKEELIHSKHIQMTAMGAKDNEDIYKFYEFTPITAFISVSASEGIPVSMMEAISFGIPVISTDVGGCKEIVTPNSGTLIPKDSSPEQIAKSILDFYSSNMNSIEFRQKVREYWLKTFDMRSNYKQLFEILHNGV
ncbi:MAG TPA: glycosyltransferase, partial [Bacteroidia bacterium]